MLDDNGFDVSNRKGTKNSVMPGRLASFSAVSGWNGAIGRLESFRAMAGRARW